MSSSSQLPAGWTQHIAPGGRVYYYNASSKQSTYSIPQKPKEKPLHKREIPGTDWLQITTSEGNIFYTHRVGKRSVWIVPEEIQDAVRALDDPEQLEIARVKAELQQGAKRSSAEHDSPHRKRARLESSIESKQHNANSEPSESDRENDDDEQESGGDDEAKWQQVVAEEKQKAAEAAAELAKRNDEEEEERETAATAGPAPEFAHLAFDEAKILFKTLLRERNINPLHPWDKSLPLFINDPRYLALSTVSSRRDAFDEYCKERARELRSTQVKEATATAPRELFEQLLREEVKSTRTSWVDWRRTWKKDRRFYGWGRDDKKREKRFREFLKGLGERKRAQAEKAERDFFLMLREHADFPMDSWKDVKNAFYKDPRYDAVGSSTLREELFNTFQKSMRHRTSPDPTSGSVSKGPKPSIVSEGETRQERAMRERARKVLDERNRVETEIGRSRQGLSMEEGERDFQTMLTDAIRDPQTSWLAAKQKLLKDPRFTSSPLPPNMQLQFFNTHVDKLRDVQVQALQALFAAHAPSLATRFSDLSVNSLLASPPATKLGYDNQELEAAFSRWNRSRNQNSRNEFDKMLSENSFVEFWGRVNKIGGEGVNGGVKRDDGEGDDGEGGGGKADLKALARSIDLEDIEKVIKNDKRYIVFDHTPEQREQWLRDYIANLAAPKLSVHT